MTDWQFLIQKAGDRAWLPLDASSTEILEGRYRIVARSSRSETAAEIRITHYAIAEIPPKRRVQRRTSRINADGLMMILPFTVLKPGLWEVRCMADVMADFFGESWSHAVRLQVLANSDTQDDWDLDPDGMGEPEPTEIPVTAVVAPEPALAPAAPLPVSPAIAPNPAPNPVSPADLPLVAALTSPDPSDLDVPSDRVTQPAAINPEINPDRVPDVDVDPLLASTLAQDLDQAMQTLLAALATSPLNGTTATAVSPGVAADLGPLTTADQDSQSDALVPDPAVRAAFPTEERLQAIAQQISEQVVERALQEFDLDAVFSGLQELLETLPPPVAPVPESVVSQSLGTEQREADHLGADHLGDHLGDHVTVGAVPLAAVPFEAAEAAAATLTANSFPLPDADLLVLGPLQLTLEQEAYVVRRGQPLRLQGQVTPCREGGEITTAAMGELQLCLRDPQTLKILASTCQRLPIATLPVDFCCEVHIPADCTTQLLLGDVNLVQLTQPDAPLLTDALPWAERQRLQQEADATGRVLAQSSAQTAHLLATYAFTIAADVAELLPNGVLVPDPQIIAPPAVRPERPRIDLPVASADTPPLCLQPSPAAKAPAAAEFLLKHPSAPKAKEEVDLPRFAGDSQPTLTPHSSFLTPHLTGLSASFIEISKRSPAVPVPTQPAVLHPLPEQIYHPDPDTLRQLSPKLPAIPSLSAQLAAQAETELAAHATDAAAEVRVNTQVELVLTHASVALPPLANLAEGGDNYPTVANAALEPPATAEDRSPLEVSGASEAHLDPGSNQPNLRSLNLGQRFWSRLNAIAADAELADWLREQAAAEREAESPAVAAFMTEGRLPGTADWSVDWSESEGWPSEDDTTAIVPDIAPDIAPDDIAPDTDIEPADWDNPNWGDDEWTDDEWAGDPDSGVVALADALDANALDTDVLVDEADEESDWATVSAWDADWDADATEIDMGEAGATIADGEYERESSAEMPHKRAAKRPHPVQQLQALTPDPTLTAEMEAFLDCLEQGPDWSATDAPLAATPEPASSPALATISAGVVSPESAVSPEVEISPEVEVSSEVEISSDAGDTPEAEATLTAREIEARLMPSEESAEVTVAPTSPTPVLPRLPAPHAEILIEDDSPPPTPIQGRVLSHPSLFYRLAEDEPVPVPVLSLPNQELVSGQSITLCVRLAKTPAWIQVKVWVQDRQTRQVLDGPRWLVDFFPCGDAVVEAWTQLTVPLGCLEIQFEAIAIEIYSQRESHKTSLGRSVIPPELTLSPLGSQGQQGYSVF